MMKNIVLAALLFMTTSAGAQVPRWVLHPKYDNIEMLGNGFYLVTNNGRTGVMNASEKEVVPLQYDKVSPFNTHYALVYKDGRFVGYMSDQGRVKEFPAGQYQVAEQPSFYDGYLVVSNINGYLNKFPVINVREDLGNYLGTFGGMSLHLLILFFREGSRFS
jgi:hypothetical protein